MGVDPRIWCIPLRTPGVEHHQPPPGLGFSHVTCISLISPPDPIAHRSIVLRCKLRQQLCLLLAGQFRVSIGKRTGQLRGSHVGCSLSQLKNKHRPVGSEIGQTRNFVPGFTSFWLARREILFQAVEKLVVSCAPMHAGAVCFFSCALALHGSSPEGVLVVPYLSQIGNTHTNNCGVLIGL